MLPILIPYHEPPVVQVRFIEPRLHKTSEIEEEIEKVDEKENYKSAWFTGNIFRANPLLVGDRRFSRSKRKR